MCETRSKYKNLSINTVLFSISSFGSKLISFLLVPLYTHILTTSEYGRVDIISTTVQLLIPLLTINIQDAVLRFALDKEYDKEDIIGSAVKLILISTAVLGLALVVIDLTGILTIDNQYLVFLFASYICGSFYNCFSMYLRARDKVKTITIYGILNAFITGILNLVLLLVFHLGVTGYLIANVVGNLIAVLGMFFSGSIYREIRFENANHILRVLLPFSLPLVVNSLAWWLNNASDRYILTYFAGAAANGIYAVSYKIPTILATIQTVFYNAWSISAITEFDKDDKDGFIGNIYSLYSSVSIFSCSIILIFNIALAKALYLNDFFVAWQFVPPLLIGTIFNGLALFQGCLFTAVKDTKAVSNTTLWGAGINTILNFALIPHFGALGASVSTMIGYFTIFILRNIMVKNYITMQVDWTTHYVSLFIVLCQSLIALNSHLYFLQIPLIILLVIVQRKWLYKVFLKSKNMIRNIAHE